MVRVKLKEFEQNWKKISLSLSKKNTIDIVLVIVRVTVTMILNFNSVICQIKKHFRKSLDISNAFENTYAIGNDCLIYMKYKIDWK